jgi:acyl-CoA thioester hydrolase
MSPVHSDPGPTDGVRVRDSPSVSRVRVRYSETDQMGVVYHANYFVWFEVGRTDLLRSTGWSYRELEAEGVSLPVIQAHCEYRLPARYDDELEIRTSGAILTHVRVEFSYEIVRVADGALLVTGHTMHAALDRDGRPCRLPARIRALLDDKISA